MPLKSWKQLSSKIITSNRFWDYRLDEFIIDGGKKGEYHYVHTGGSSMVVPITDNGKIILVNQYRYLNQRESLEFPCGSISVRLTAVENANKELREETGYSARDLVPAGFFSPFNGVTDEMCYVFIARKLVPDRLIADETEEFELYELSGDEVDELIYSNLIWDGMTIAAWTLAKKMITNNKK